MEEKLNEIYSFLNDKRHFNKFIQEQKYMASIIPYQNTKDKVISLLYDIANTQRQPKIDLLAIFFRDIQDNLDEVNTFQGFLRQISDNEELTFKNLFYSLKDRNGWGNKTAALFVKAIYHLHNGKYRDDLKIWPDVPNQIKNTDDFFLPVDSVIIAIFNNIDPNINWDFFKINNKIKEFFQPEEIEVWDDLWFWGFISQSGSGGNRNFGWNENKYWLLKESNKNIEIIGDIQFNVGVFLNILNGNE